MSYFSEKYNCIRYPKEEANSRTSGLRNAQIGAIHA